MAKRNTKKKQPKKPVQIRRVRAGVNYRVTYDYDAKLTSYIKENLPREHWKVHKESFYDPNTKSTKDIWSRDIRKFSIGKVISFLVDNAIKFEFVGMTSEEIDELRNEFRERQAKLRKILQEKTEGLDVSDMKFDNMLITPYDYQKKAVKFFEMNDGNAILADQPGVGKQAGLDTLISTPFGWKRMGDMKVGDIIHNRFGSTSQVTGVFPQGFKDSYKITFNDDSFTYCGREHLWSVRDKNRRQRGKGWSVKTLEEIMSLGLEYKVSPSRAKTNRNPVLKWEIPVTEPVWYSEKEYYIHPYILGCAIGDGSMTTIPIKFSIPNHQKQIKEKIEELVHEGYHLSVNEYPSCPQYYLRKNVKSNKPNEYFEEIKNLELNVRSGEKFIPEEYYVGSVEQRIDLLRGLMDTDGSCDRNRSNYHTTSEELAKNVVELVQSLGGIAKINVYDRSHQDKSTEYRVNIKTHFCPFYLEEKVAQWKPVYSNKISKYIKSIELHGMEEQQCISTNSDDHTYLTDSFIVTHNTCSAFSYAARHNFKTLIICPSSLKLNWKREIKDFLDQDSFVYKYNPPRRSKKVNYPKEDCNFHIINYESLDTYFKYEFSHKCGTPGCDFGEISLDKSYKKCPLCSTPKSVKSRRKNLLEFEDKTGMTLNPEDYDLVILDECHYIKNEMAQRTKTIKKAFKDVPRKILISGTPIKSRPIEFFSILNFLRPEEFNSSHEFGKRYGAGFQDNYGWKYDGASNLEELFERVQPYFLRRLKSDVLELPPKTFVDIPIELSSKQMNEYTKVEEGVVEQLNGEDNSGEKKSALEIILELKRYVSAIKVKESLPIIRDMVEQGEKIVVFSEFQDSAEAIKEAFGNQAVMIHGSVSTEDRDNAVQSFQDPDSDVMVFSGTIGAAGVGLTLTRSSNLLFIGSAWTPSDMEQAQDRVHRASTTANKVTIMTLYCEDTIDEYIMQLLSEKSAVVDKAIDNKVNKKKIEKTDSLSQEVSNGSIVGALIAKLTEGNF